MEVLNDFFKDTEISSTNLVGVCTDGALAMLGSRSGFVALVKHKNPAVEGTHCLIPREALVSKSIPKNLYESLVVIIKIVNYVKGSALNTRLFRARSARTWMPTTLLFYSIHKFVGFLKETCLLGSTNCEMK